MTKSALGRGLGELLDPAKSEKHAPVPSPNPAGAGWEGGVTTLLRGKSEPSPASLRAASAHGASPAPDSRIIIVLSLVAADACLVLAGCVITSQNPFALAPWSFSLGLVLTGFGGWLGCLAWRHATSP